MIQAITVQRALLRALVFAAVSLPIAAQAANDDVVLLWGTSTDVESMISQDQYGQPQSVDTAQLMPSNICGRLIHFISQNSPPSFDLGTILFNDEEDSSDSPNTSLGDIAMECQFGQYDPDPATSSEQSDIWLIYTSCSMTMGDGANIMRWTVPPLAAEAEMTILDLAENTAFTVQLETDLRDVNAATGGAATGNLRDYDINGPNGSQQVTLQVDGREREFQAKSYEYKYTGDVGAGVAGLAAIQAGRIDSEGQAWIVPDAPGADVVSLFYQNFADHVRPAAGMGSMIDGMIKQMAGLTRLGMPVRTNQTVKMIGNSFQAIGAETGTRMESESESTIDRIAIVPGRGSQTCGATVIPEGMAVTSFNDLMAGAMGAAGSGGAGAGAVGGAPNPMDSPEFKEAMAEMAEQMEGMSDEEKQMMEQFGLGSMLGGAASIDSSADASGDAGPSALTAGSGSAGAGSSGSGKAMPSSAELTTENLLESVQKHLDALGYNPGNTDGTPSVMTEVAISQFQAENDMAVVGKVTPQVLGVLSAKVDSK